jgi:hypothetical protein
MMENEKECCMMNISKEEVIKMAVALTNYTDKYIRENEILEEECYCVEEGMGCIDKLITMRDKIKAARMVDYKDYPELIEVDYSLIV